MAAELKIMHLSPGLFFTNTQISETFIPVHSSNWLIRLQIYLGSGLILARLFNAGDGLRLSGELAPGSLPFSENRIFVARLP